MKDYFHFFPTVEEETYNVTKYYQLVERMNLLKKLIIAFVFTTAIAGLIYSGTYMNNNSYKLYSFIILCIFFNFILYAVLLVNSLLLHLLTRKSYQIPGKTKEFVDVSLNNLYQLLEDDFSIHHNVNETIATDESLTRLEKSRFDLICELHFFMWKTLNEYAYDNLLANTPSEEEMANLKEQQKQYKDDFLRLFANSPEICEKINQWYRAFEEKIIS
ncbi:MAG: hypothetical protein IJ220_05525 [Clostridia bacterium]|nr:hypothetical protein [Clostridia bacterium]